jgi:hypothetical protein
VTDELLKSVDTWYWVDREQISLAGKPFTMVGHEYQIALLQDDSPRQCAKKGAQMGFTEACVLKTLHGHIAGKYPQGTLYLFPTQNDVTDFSKGRFNPLIVDNPSIARYVQDTDAANIKRIGGGMLYLRGARVSQKIQGTKKSSSALKSVPVDRLVFDEIDEMSPQMVDLALERISHSTVKEEFYLSTPTIPDYGIDKLYQSSDQRVWVIRCEKCNHETCLEIEFPECLRERGDGTVFRACTKCGAEIHPRDGRWVATYPDRSNDLVGWWISQLNSVYVNPADILRLYHDPPNGNLAEIYNSKLAMAWIAAENRLSAHDLMACLGRDPMYVNHTGPCAMGIDVGADLHVVIGFKPNKKTVQIAYMGRFSKFEDIHDLAQRFNVRCAVIDALPETRKVRDFQEAERYESFLCWYDDHLRTSARWNLEKRDVAVNRTEVCDATHHLVVTPDNLLLPRRSDEVDEYIKQMCNIAKVLEEDPETGSKEYRYRKLGPDHYRHAMNYLLLASTRIGVAEDSKREIQVKAFTEYDQFSESLDPIM